MLYQRIYEARRKLDKQRQPETSHQLRELWQLLSEFEVDHPYTLAAGLGEEILKNPIMRNGSSGKEITSASHHYLYRITSIKSVVTDSGLSWRNSIERNRSNSKIWEALETQYQQRKTWLSLGHFARGRLAGFRNFTWWTDERMARAGALDVAHKAGIPNDWVAQHALILRCNLQPAPCSIVMRTPSAVDGFLSVIFLSQKDAESNNGGITIDITDKEKLREGVAEYALSLVPAEVIQFMPVEIDGLARSKTPVGLSEELLQALLRFYLEKTQ